MEWFISFVADTGRSVAAPPPGCAGPVRAEAHRRAGAGRTRPRQARGPALDVYGRLTTRS